MIFEVDVYNVRVAIRVITLKEVSPDLIKAANAVDCTWDELIASCGGK